MGRGPAPFNKFEKWLKTEYGKKTVHHNVKMVFWQKEYNAAVRAKVEPDEVKAAIEKLADIVRRKPVRPNFPSVTFPGGGTLEGLINSFKSQVPSSISSTAEGAQFFRGAAFGESNSAASASMAIDLIDKGAAGRDLMGDGSPDKGRIRLDDIRFSQITAVQPDVIAPVLKGLEHAGQGYHARYLKVAPEPIAYKREFDSLSVTRIDQDPRVLAYNEVMRLMLHSWRFTGRGLECIHLTLVASSRSSLRCRGCDDHSRSVRPGDGPPGRAGQALQRAGGDGGGEEDGRAGDPVRWRALCVRRILGAVAAAPRWLHSRRY